MVLTVNGFFKDVTRTTLRCCKINQYRRNEWKGKKEKNCKKNNQVDNWKKFTDLFSLPVPAKPPRREISYVMLCLLGCRCGGTLQNNPTSLSVISDINWLCINPLDHGDLHLLARGGAMEKPIIIVFMSFPIMLFKKCNGNLFANCPLHHPMSYKQFLSFSEG